MTKRFSMILFFVILFSVLAVAGISPRRVTVSGNDKIRRSEVLDILGIETRTDISDQELNEAIQRLVDTHYFRNVSYEYDSESRLLHIEVEEYAPVRVSLVYDGPDIVSKRDLLNTSITFEDRMPINPRRLMVEIPRSIDNIMDALQEAGYIEPFVKVSWDSVPDRTAIARGEVNEEITVTFKITVFYLWDLVIDAGLSEDVNEELKELTELDIMKDYYDIAKIFRWVYSKKRYVPTSEELVNAYRAVFSTYYANPNGSLGMDQAVSRAFMLAVERGLKNPRIVPMPEGEKGQALELVISFSPVEYVASPFSLKSIFIEGNKNVAGLRLIEATELEEGTMIDSEAIATALQKMYAEYSKQGYPFTRLTASTEARFGFLRFKATELTVNEIEVAFDGDQKTRDYLIYDKIVIEKGQVLSLKDFRNTYSFLNATGYFESVLINPKPISDTQLDVDIILKEKENNGRLSGGGGWQDGLMLNLELGFLNPFGLGQDISAMLDINIPVGPGKTKETDEGIRTRHPSYDVSLSYMLPRVMGSQFDLEASVGLNISGYDLLSIDDDTDEETESNYKEIDLNGSIAPAYRISPAQRVSLRPGYEYIEKSKTVDGELEDGQMFTGMFVIGTYRYSTRDDIMRPTQGTDFSVRLSTRGLFHDGDDRYGPFAGVTADYKLFIPLDGPVLGIRAVVEHVAAYSGDYEVYEKYRLSPSRFLRVSPKFIVSPPYLTMSAASLQLRLPITDVAQIPVDLVIFGNIVLGGTTRIGESGWDAFGGFVAADAGLSVDIGIPLLGTVRLGYGLNTQNLEKNPYGQFFFGFGPTF